MMMIKRRIGLMCMAIAVGANSHAVSLEEVIPQNGTAPVPAAGERAFWDAKKGEPLIREIIRLGDQALSEKVVFPGRELYLEFWEKGERTGYEGPYARFRRNLHRLGNAAVVSGDQKYIPRLEEMIKELCSAPSWILPAHDVEQKTMNGELIRIDLVSAHVGWDLTLLRQLLGDRLSPETGTMIDREVAIRIIDPFERMLDGRQPPHWLRSRNNWSVVCLAGVGGTLLAASDITPERRYRLLNGVTGNLRHFLASFGKDGYCSEGMSYWRYGFGHYLRLGTALHLASDGKINLMNDKQAILAASYPERIAITENIIPAFSDCYLTEKLPVDLLGICDWLRGTPSVYWKNLRVGASVAPSVMFHNMMIPPPEASELAGKVVLTPFSEFADSGIFVVRPGEYRECRLAAAFKGGSNFELHNHNDVGSYVLVIDGAVVMTADPGLEVYSRRSFGPDRYKSNLNNSFGHSVPRIGGMLQSTGRETDAEVLEKITEDHRVLIRIDIRKAYREISGIDKLERIFEYERDDGGVFRVTDQGNFAEPVTFETAVITFADWKEAAPGIIHLSRDGRTMEMKIDTGGIPFSIQAETIRENIRYKENPTRIGIALDQPASSARIRLEYKGLANK